MRGASALVDRDSAFDKPLSERRAPNTQRHVHSWLLIWIAIAFAFLLAAVQILPTWELKRRSQRMDFAAEFFPGYGHLPPQYWTQFVAPWLWYPYNVDELLVKLPNYSGGAGTNQVEAHLYFGLLPLLLAIGGLIVSWRSRAETDRVLRLWALIGVAFLLYTPGWFLPVTQYLPGFSFFRGPGRYGIITSLAVALIAGNTFSRLLKRMSAPGNAIVAVLVFAITAIELSWVAESVGYSQMLPVPVVERRLESPVHRLLLKESQPVRLVAPMANVANMLDASSFPVYLGIGPGQYFDPRRHTAGRT